MYIPSDNLKNFLVQTLGDNHSCYSIDYLIKLLYNHVFSTHQLDSPNNISIMFFNEDLSTALDIQFCHCADLPFYIRRQLMVIPFSSAVTTVSSTQKVIVSPDFANLVCNGKINMTYIEVHSYFAIYLNIHHPSIFGPTNPYMTTLFNTPLGDVLKIRAMHKTQMPQILRSQLEFLCPVFPPLSDDPIHGHITVLQESKYNSSPVASTSHHETFAQDTSILASRSTSFHTASTDPEINFPYVLPLYPDMILDDGPLSTSVNTFKSCINILSTAINLSPTVSSYSDNTLQSHTGIVVATDPDISNFSVEFDIASDSDNIRPPQAYGKSFLDNSCSTVTESNPNLNICNSKFIDAEETSNDYCLPECDESVSSILSTRRSCIVCKVPTEVIYCTSCMDIRKQWIYRKKSPKTKPKNKFINRLCSIQSSTVTANPQHYSSAVPTCDICMTSPKNAVFVHGSTSHMSCYQCARNSWAISNRCPFCRRWVNNIVKVL